MSTQILARAPVFARLRPEDLESVTATLVERRFKARQTLCQEGDSGDSLYVLIEGSLAVYRGPSKTILATLTPGDVVGEMACIDPAPRSATVVALKDCVAYEMTRLMFDVLQRNAPALASAIIAGLTDSLTARMRRVHARIASRDQRHGAPQRGPNPRRLGQPVPITPKAMHPHPDIASIEAFSALDPKGIDTLKEATSALVWPDGATLCCEGDPGMSCFLMVRGTVEVIKDMHDGPRVIATLGRGSILGQLALVDRGPRTATVRAAGTVVALEFSRESFEQLLAEVNPLAIHFQRQCAVACSRQLLLADKWLIESSRRPPQPPRPEPTRPVATPKSTLQAMARDNTQVAPQARQTRPVASVDPHPTPNPAQEASPHNSRTRPVGRFMPRDPVSYDDDTDVEHDAADLSTYVDTAIDEWALDLVDLDEVTFVPTKK